MPQPSTKNLTQATSVHLKDLADKQLFGGVVAIAKGGKVVFQQAYGQAYPELKVPMTVDTKMVVGENSCLFTAVAIWQLAEANLLTLDDPVTDYMHPIDFGRRSEWHPRLQNGTPCVPPTVRQLLMMSSGIVDYIGAEYTPGDWQYGHLFSLSDLTDVGYHEVLQGKIRVAELFGSYSWDTPLEFLPGTDYRFSRTNFWLATYIIEKVSAMSLQDYLQRNVFKPANLLNTTLDCSGGISHTIIPNAAPIPGYVSTFGLLPGDPVPSPGSHPVTANGTTSIYGTSPGISQLLPQMHLNSMDAADVHDSAMRHHFEPARVELSNGSFDYRPTSIERCEPSSRSMSSLDSFRQSSTTGARPVLASWVSIKSDVSRSLRVELSESMRSLAAHVTTDEDDDDEEDFQQLLPSSAHRSLETRVWRPVQHLHTRRDESSVMELATCFGSGGIMSTAEDMIRWHWALLANHEMLALSTGSVRQMLTSCNHNSRCGGSDDDDDENIPPGRRASYKPAAAAYGQGVVIHTEPDAPLGVRALYHSGKQAGFRSQVLTLVDPVDMAESLSIAVLTNWNPILDGIGDEALDELHEDYFEAPMCEQVTSHHSIFCESGGLSVAVLQYLVHTWSPEQYCLVADVLDVLNE